MSKHWKSYLGKPFLGSWDLYDTEKDDYTPIVAVIKNVIRKNLNKDIGEDREAFVATFTDSNLKPMILNTGNATIVERFAKQKDFKKWLNVPVTITVAKNIKAFGKTTDALRFSPAQPKLELPTLTKSMPAFEAVKKHLAGGGKIKDVELKYKLTDDIRTALLDTTK